MGLLKSEMSFEFVGWNTVQIRKCSIVACPAGAMLDFSNCL